jgi:hypothetical protein
MQLRVLRDRAEELAERNISDPAFLLACAQVVRLIEGRSYKILSTKRGQIQLTAGIDTYSLNSLDTNQDAVLEIWYSSANGPAVLLLPVDFFPPNPEGLARLAPAYYNFVDGETIALDTQRAAGQLTILSKAFLEPYEETFTLDTDIPYSPMLTGVISYLGKYIWEDSRSAVWAEAFETQLKMFTRNAERRAAKIGNLGSRMPPSLPPSADTLFVQ